MEREMGNLQGQYKLVEQTYGQDMLNLVLAKGYLARLLENESLHRYASSDVPRRKFIGNFQELRQKISLFTSHFSLNMTSDRCPTVARPIMRDFWTHQTRLRRL